MTVEEMQRRKKMREWFLVIGIIICGVFFVVVFLPWITGR